MWCRDGFTFPLTDGQMDAYYAELERDPRAWGFTALDEDGKLVGSFKMAAADYEADSVHMGYIVLAPEVHGRNVRRGASRYEAGDAQGIRLQSRREALLRKGGIPGRGVSKGRLSLPGGDVGEFSDGIQPALTGRSLPKRV